MTTRTIRCIEWFNHNHMTANKGKCQSLVFSKQYTNIEEFVVNNEFKITMSDTVTLPGVQIDNRLKYDSHIQKICTKASLQLNFLKRLAGYIGSKEKFILIKSFILCLFNYCPLVWLFCSKDSQQKLGKRNKRALRLALSDYSSSYSDLPQKTKFTTVHIHSSRQLALEVFKTLHNLNPAFMKNYFIPKPSNYDLRKRDMLYIPKVKSTRYGNKSLRFLGPKIWNSLPDNIKLSNTINQFETLIYNWFSVCAWPAASNSII